ncbi:MAG: insulinase family protein, partial [Bdellovibrionales bacterium]|nr:insulinase family protein [Bdellovibrionales bacterium]
MTFKKLLFLAAVFCVTISCTQKEQGPGTKSATAPAARVINGMEFVPLKLENALEVLIISDPRFKQSSAAMAVAVGSLEDPENAAGMAHYLEHMLFLGTKEFPNHDDYSTYMEKNGGGDNAYTADDVTNYFFDVDNSALDGALHRFSRFFVSPLFDPTYVDREKNAVNSEFEKNIKNDSWRSMRFLTLQAADGHPLKKFTIGNKTTLKNVNREQVMEFYKKYYSASTMRLVVMTAQPSHLVKGWVTQYFSDIPNTKAQPPQYKDEYFDPKQKARYHYVKAITDIDELTVYFNIPDTIKYWDSKPVNIITKIIGYEGKGSLLSYLKKKGWALELSVGNYFTRTLNIDITLTPEGRKNHEKVTASVFEFIRMMNEKGYPEYLYDDEKFLQKIALDNLEPSSSSNRSAFFAKAMVDYPVDSFLEKYFLLSKYSVEDFKYFMSYLKPENAHVVVSSQKEKTNKKEDIFGIQYRSEELPAATLQFLDKESTVFEYPPKNEYIPND